MTALNEDEFIPPAECRDRAGGGRGHRGVFEAGDRPFIISHSFDAARETLWKAWTERAELMKWFGPKGFTMPAAKMEFRPGGMFHYCL